MITNLVQIPRDVLIHDLLDQLSVPDLVQILTTNKELEKYLDIFVEKIEDYREDLRHRREVARPKYIENIERNQQNVATYKRQNDLNGVAGIIALDDQLAQSMDVESLGLPRLRGQILYPQSGLIKWWLIYVRDNNLIHSSSIPARQIIIVDDLISSLLNIPVGSNINFATIIQQLLQQHTELIREPVSDLVLHALNQEMRELDAIYSKYQ